MCFFSNIWLNHRFMHALDFPRKNNIIENFALLALRWVLRNHNKIYLKKEENRNIAFLKLNICEAIKRLNGTFAERREKKWSRNKEKGDGNEDGMSNIENLNFIEFKGNSVWNWNGSSSMKLIEIHLLNEWQRKAICKLTQLRNWIIRLSIDCKCVHYLIMRWHFGMLLAACNRMIHLCQILNYWWDEMR